MTWNWQAHTAWAITASAVGSFLVAVIAVLPIFRERKRRREQAINLRFRLKDRFATARYIIQPGRALLTMGAGTDDLDPLVSEIDTLGVQADILEPEENDAVNNMIANLKAAQLTMRDSPRQRPAIASQLTKELLEAERILGDHLRVSPQSSDQDPDTQNPTDKPDPL